RMAAAAMRPHFEGCVDDFASRLREFVAAAGNTLYKGISEVLDRTIDERRQADGQVEPLRAATNQQIAAVGAVKNAIVQLREALWQSAEGHSEDKGADGAAADAESTETAADSDSSGGAEHSGADDGGTDDGGADDHSASPGGNSVGKRHPSDDPDSPA
ncbi:MAG: hypothetical protein AAGC55_25265, partial [Myxococcota bacterium]